MTFAMPRNCSGVRSPRVTLTWTVLKPFCRWAWTLSARKRSKALRSPTKRRGRSWCLRGPRRAVRCPRGVAARGAGAEACSSSVEAQAVDVEVALGDPVAAQLLLDDLAERFDADLVDEHLDARACAVDAQEVGAVEDPEDRLGDLQVLAVVEPDERKERRRDARHDRRPASDAHLAPAAHRSRRPWR